MFMIQVKINLIKVIMTFNLWVIQEEVLWELCRILIQRVIDQEFL